MFRANEAAAAENMATVAAAIVARGGRIVSRARIIDIAYHAILADLPVWTIRQIVQQAPESIAGLEAVMHIRPQSVATGIDVDDPLEPDPGAIAPRALGEPILALLDGVPVANHRLLADHMRIDDQFELVPDALDDDGRGAGAARHQWADAAACTDRDARLVHAGIARSKKLSQLQAQDSRSRRDRCSGGKRACQSARRQSDQSRHGVHALLERNSPRRASSRT